jgi:hypothetical protein
MTDRWAVVPAEDGGVEVAPLGSPAVVECYADAK